MTRIAAVAGAFPAHAHDQSEITSAFGEVVLGGEASAPPDGPGDGADGRPDGRAGGGPGAQAVLERLHAATTVRTRHLALPLDAYAELDGFGAANDAFVEVGLGLAESAVAQALARASLTPRDVDLIMSVSVTGVAAPSLDARLVGRLGLREDVKRIPVFGLGCVAGAAGVARVHDHLVGHPDAVAVLVSVELCSLTLQRHDTSMANLVASGLFGDGAQAVVMVGERRAEALGLAAAGAPRVVASRSRFYPDTERVMGWDIGASGFRVVLSADVPTVVEAHLGDDVRAFLEDHDLKVADIGTWVAHPGGPKVLEAMQRSLDLPEGALDVTWRCLAETGNLSSASVLQVLGRTLDEGRVRRGEPGLLLAMGPGFCAELVLLEL